MNLVSNLFSIGLSTLDTEIVAVHGGPLESVLALIRTGKWPAGSVFKRDILEGDDAMRPTLSFFTIEEHILANSELSNIVRLRDPKAGKSFRDAVVSAEAFNSISVESAAILTLLDLPINRSSMSAIAHVTVENFNNPEFLEYLRAKKLTLVTVLSALKIVREANIGGVVIGIDKQAFINAAKILKAPNGGVAIDLPDGLPIEWIRGIEVFGDPEYKFLENIGDHLNAP